MSKTDFKRTGYAYYRLSNEEAKNKESESITNQRLLVNDYCERNGISIVKEFVDDGYSGGNFNRPGFRDMIRHIEKFGIDVVLTKDLSRLGRDMNESSYYAEVYFAEHDINFIATHGSFDSNEENAMTPFMFAMNEAYLREGSKKIKDTLKGKRERGQYCACPPYGYMKDPNDKSKLILDEITASVVKRIFERAADGDSSRKIALDLVEDGIIPPLKYRVLYRDNFGEKGASRASDEWNYTTVKRILKNEVYLGHTILGKTKKVSIKSQKKKRLPEKEWCITYNTHIPIVSEDIFEKAQKNLGKGTKDYRQYEHVRRSIFSGVAVCSLCGYSLCSSGSVYKGEREKYWYLSCTHRRKDIPNPCKGTSVRYADLVELIRRELNSFINLTQEEKKTLAEEVLNQSEVVNLQSEYEVQLEKAVARRNTINNMFIKLYSDNAEGKISDEQLDRMISELKKEDDSLKIKTVSLKESIESTRDIVQSYENFFSIVEQYTYIEELDRDTLLAFVEKVEIGEKILPDGYQKLTHPDTPYEQRIRIYYKFIGQLSSSSLINLPIASGL